MEKVQESSKSDNNLDPSLVMFFTSDTDMNYAVSSSDDEQNGSFKTSKNDLYGVTEDKDEMGTEAEGTRLAKSATEQLTRLRLDGDKTFHRAQSHTMQMPSSSQSPEKTTNAKGVAGNDGSGERVRKKKPKKTQDKLNPLSSVTLISQLIQDKALMEKYIITREQEFDYVYRNLRDEVRDLRFCLRAVAYELNSEKCDGKKRKIKYFEPHRLENDSMVMAHICDLQNKISELKLHLYHKQVYISDLEHERLLSHQEKTESTTCNDELPGVSRFSDVLTTTRASYAPYGNNDPMVAMVDSCHIGERPPPVAVFPEDRMPRKSLAVYRKHESESEELEIFGTSV